MHEISIMEEAVRMALDAAKSAGACRVTGLRLRVGVLSGAEPEALRFAWDVVCHQTIAEGARLEIVSMPATGWCPKCEDEFSCISFFTECPRCGVLSKKLLHGRELEIASVEVE